MMLILEARSDLSQLPRPLASQKASICREEARALRRFGYTARDKV